LGTIPGVISENSQLNKTQKQQRHQQLFEMHKVHDKGDTNWRHKLTSYSGSDY